MITQTRRDLTLIHGFANKSLVIACDTCAAVGEKDGDILNLPAHYVGKFTSRVALTEVMCSGAKPITLINGAANEMQPTAEAFIQGIQEELKNADITDIVLTGSTEENFTTNMTALAVTVIGVASEDELKFKKASKGDKLVLLGSPKVGAEVDLDSVGFYSEIKKLLCISGVKEIVPVGSKGVAYEAENLALINGMAVSFYDTPADLHKSAGPATCIVVLCSEDAVSQVLDVCLDACVVGEFLHINKA